MDGKERRGNCIGQSEERTHLLRKPQKATQVVRRDKGCPNPPGHPAAVFGNRFDSCSARL